MSSKHSKSGKFKPRPKSVAFAESLTPATSSSKSKSKSKSKHTSSAKADPRFDALTSDARYRLPSKKNTHVKLDKRLGSILKDDAFSRKASVDRYGRKVGKGQGKQELKKLYRLDSDDEEGGSESGSGEDSKEEDDDDELGSGEDDKVVAKALRAVDKKYDPARDGGFSTSESESDSDDSDLESEADAELPDLADSVPMGDVSRRLAVVNLDWDNIKAEDIMVVANSFVPPEGKLLSVAVYPSEFGRERMQREEMEGPPKEIFQATDKAKATSSKSKIKPLVKRNEKDLGSDDENDGGSSEDEEIKKELLQDQEDEGADFDSVALRKYQLDRLRYFYAVITCSTKGVAKALYDNMDGQEFLASANFFDMRFIPDDTNFDDDQPRDACDSVPEKYKPSDFTTDALMHSNVKLTWDVDDAKRKEVQKRAFSKQEIEENDLLAYIGSASSEDDEDDEDEPAVDSDDPDGGVKSTTSHATTRAARREALRAALGLDLEPSSSRTSRKDLKAVGDMQVTFTPALSSSKAGASVFENEIPTREETTADAYVRKERERKQKRKEKQKARRAGLEPDVAVTKPTDPTLSENESGDEAEPVLDGDDGGFDDPFFENPSAAIETAREDRRKEKRAKRKEAEAAEEALNAKQRAELELVLMDDSQTIGGMKGSGNKHFDIKDVERAEKNERKAAKKGKNKRGKKGNKDDDEARPDNFNLNVADDRFTKLFEDPSFAIDPTNAKYRDTKGMRQILEKKRQQGEERAAGREAGKKRKGDDGVKSLVDSVKKKIKR